MAVGIIERKFKKGELIRQNSDRSPGTTGKDLKLPLRLLQVHGCVFQTPKSTRWGTLGPMGTELETSSSLVLGRQDKVVRQTT